MVRGAYLFLIIVALNSNNIYANDNICGQNCLMAVMNEYGIATSYKEISMLSNYNENIGTSMLGLYNASLIKRLPVVPMKLSWKELDKYKGIKIVLINGNHFSILRKVCKDGVEIQDYPGNPFFISKENFLNIWHGETLVYSKKLFEKTMNFKDGVYKDGPRISISETQYNFGTVYDDEEISHQFMYKNIGSKPLTVLSRSDCSCTTTILENQITNPGEYGVLKVQFAPKGQNGNVNKSIILKTNDPAHSFLNINLYAHVNKKARIVPEELFYEYSSCDRIIKRHLWIEGGKDLKLQKIISSSNISTKTGVNIKCSDNSVIIPIDVTIKPKMISVETNSYIYIETNLDEIKKKLVKVVQIGKSNLISNQNYIFLGNIPKNKDVIRSIEIYSNNNNNYKIISVKNSSNYVNTNINEMRKGHYVLTLRVKASTSVTVKDTLNVFVQGNSGPELKVPLFANIR